MPGAQLATDLWITEYITPRDVFAHGVDDVLVSKKTEYQQMAVVSYGVGEKALVLDGKWQSCTVDEFLYHEPLVHPACVYHSAPAKVLVLGGGEGATVREVLKWRTVEKIVMVDIDGEVVAACKEHLPEMHQGAFDDPRTELIIGDALHYLDSCEGEWDVLISDLSDPIEEGPSFKLFTKEFFEKCRRALTPDGLLVLQAGPVSPTEMKLHVRLASTVRAVFPHIVSYSAHVPSYATPWGFVLAGLNPIETDIAPSSVDKLLSERTTGKFKMFDGITLRGLMHPPKHLREAIKVEKHVYTLDKPPAFSDRIT